MEGCQDVSSAYKHRKARQDVIKRKAWLQELNQRHNDIIEVSFTKNNPYYQQTVGLVQAARAKVQDETKNLRVHKVENFFQDLFSSPRDMTEQDKSTLLSTLSKLAKFQVESTLLTDFDYEECREGMKGKKGKAPGISGIPMEAYQLLGGVSISLLKDLINGWAWGLADEPKSIKMARTRLIYKSGDKTDPANYRPITVLECLYRVVSDITLSRMKKYQNNMFSGEQAGFMRNRNTPQNILYLLALMSQAKRQEKICMSCLST